MRADDAGQDQSTDDAEVAGGRAMAFSMIDLLLGVQSELKPMAEPVVLTDHGTAWLPDFQNPGARVEHTLCRGLGVAWAPIPELDKVLLYIIGGTPLAPTEEALAIQMPLRSLRTFIADLQCIERQMSDD